MHVIKYRNIVTSNSICSDTFRIGARNSFESKNLLDKWDENWSRLSSEYSRNSKSETFEQTLKKKTENKTILKIFSKIITFIYWFIIIFSLIFVWWQLNAMTLGVIDGE